MAFCTKCGNQLPESGVCANCGANPNAANTTTIYREPAGAPPNVVYVKAPPNPIITDSVASLKNLFTANPQASIATALNSSSHIWVILGGLNILLTALAFMLIPGGLIKSALGDLGGVAGNAINELLPFGSLFGGGLLLAVCSFAVLSACVKGVYAIYKIDVSFIKVLNLVSASLLIASTTTACAIIFSFFLPQLSLLLIVVGLLGAIIMLYTGVQSAASLSTSPFWAMLCVFAIDIIVISIIGNQLAASIIDGLVGNALGGISNFLW